MVRHARVDRHGPLDHGEGLPATQDDPGTTLAEVDALADALDPRWRMLVLVAAWSSLRWGELAGHLPPHLLPDLEDHLDRDTGADSDAWVMSGAKGAP